jgi:hypothetical protein
MREKNIRKKLRKSVWWGSGRGLPNSLKPSSPRNYQSTTSTTTALHRKIRKKVLALSN